MNKIIGDFIVKVSKNDGCGFFSTKAYTTGEKIVDLVGTKIKDTDRRLSHRGIQYSKHMFLEPKRYSLGFYLNHSCNPNSFVNGKALFARKTIKPGEEITADYSLFTEFPSWDMKCFCKSENCRRVIVPYSKLPLNLKRKSRKWTAKYLTRSKELIEPIPVQLKQFKSK